MITMGKHMVTSKRPPRGKPGTLKIQHFWKHPVKTAQKRGKRAAKPDSADRA